MRQAVSKIETTIYETFAHGDLSPRFLGFLLSEVYRDKTEVKIYNVDYVVVALCHAT